MGSKKKPFYRIVSTDSRNPRDGRFIDTLGYYNPLTDPVQIKVDEDGIFKWLERGAVPTESAESIMRQVGLMQKWQLLKQGVKKEEVDAKLEAMGVKLAPQAKPAPKKKPSKEAGEAKDAESPKEAEPSKEPEEIETPKDEAKRPGADTTAEAPGGTPDSGAGDSSGG